MTATSIVRFRQLITYMTLAKLTSKDLARVQKLIERKEYLNEQIAKIDSDLEAIEAGASGTNAADSTVMAAAAPKRGKGPAPKAVRGRPAGKSGRGELKERITKELRSSGSSGIRVKDLAAKLGTSYGNVTAFFQSTGKKIDEIKKVAPARYAWVNA